MSGMPNRGTEQEWYRPKKENEVTYDEIKFVHALNSTQNRKCTRRPWSVSLPPKAGGFQRFAKVDLPAAACFIYACLPPNRGGTILEANLSINDFVHAA
jgi:hypothetical protein